MCILDDHYSTLCSPRYSLQWWFYPIDCHLQGATNIATTPTRLSTRRSGNTASDHIRSKTIVQIHATYPYVEMHRKAAFQCVLLIKLYSTLGSASITGLSPRFPWTAVHITEPAPARSPTKTGFTIRSGENARSAHAGRLNKKYYKAIADFYSSTEFIDTAISIWGDTH